MKRDENGERLPILVDGKKVDISCPEKMYWDYVRKVAPVHDSRGSTLSGTLVKALALLEDCKSVLDVCGGTGRIALYLTRLGHDVKVVDLSDDMLRIARRKGLQTERQDAKHLHEPSKSRDAVICLGNSLGGIPSRHGRIQAIREMVRVARKRVVIDCLNRLSELWKIWLPIYTMRILGSYRPGLKLGNDVVTGLELGDIVWHDRDLDAVLYHHVYDALELWRNMADAGLKAKAVNPILSKRVVLAGIVQGHKADMRGGIDGSG